MHRRILLPVAAAVLLCAVCGALGYASYIDWPSFDEAEAIRAYLPTEFPLRDAHYYKYRNFMDTWDLYRFSTSPEAIAFLADRLGLSQEAVVYEFDLIISRPPPYWWHPEELREARLFRSSERAPDGRFYDLLYSQETGIAYMVRFDG